MVRSFNIFLNRRDRHGCARTCTFCDRSYLRTVHSQSIRHSCVFWGTGVCLRHIMLAVPDLLPFWQRFIGVVNGFWI